MPRAAQKEVPRWKKQRGSTQPSGFTPVQLNGRHGRRFARELATATAQLQQQGTGGRKEGTAATVTLARTGAWRFRRHLPPFGYLAALLAVTAALHAAPLRVLWGTLASIVIPAMMVLAVRVKGRDGNAVAGAWVRRCTDLEAAHASLWLFLVPLRGLHPCLALLLATWAPFAAFWVRRYRWRPDPAAKQPEAATGDLATWEKLAAKRKWSGHLTAPEEIPGGRKWQIELDGTETHIGEVMAEPKRIAAAWGKAMTEAYVEPHPTGVESRGVLTVLRAGTLEEVRDWSGAGFDTDGIARIGRFADGQPARIRCWVPMDGTRHSLIAGGSGAGKSYLLDLIIWLALTSPVPIVPVVLDPQNGQSLPQWRDKLLYASGVEECVRMNRALYAGMMDRSRRLASMTWDDDGHTVKGMDFFDSRLCGLPIVMIITDEAPILLSGDGNAKLGAEMVGVTAKRAKLGRKAGNTEALVAQVPSLGELGDQALRAQLVGGNVISLRTGEKVSAGMLGLQADPSSLPKYFPSGAATQGLGYVVSVDNRQAPMRSDLVPRAMRHQAVEVPQLEDDFLEAMAPAFVVSPTATVAPLNVVKAIHEAGALMDRAEQAEAALAQATAPPAESEPEGRRCIDAVWQVLSDRGADMERGEVISWTGDKARSWDRKPWSIKAVSNALRDLVEGKEPGRSVTKPRDGVYRAVITQSPADDHEQRTR